MQDFCLEILHNETSRSNVPTLVLCNSNEDKDPEYLLSESSPLSQLLNVRRCCLNNAVFDVKTGGCELDDYYSKTDHFLPILTDYLRRDKSHIDDIKPVLIHRGLPECTLGAVFTYEIDVADIVFENGTLKVSWYLNVISLFYVRFSIFFEIRDFWLYTVGQKDSTLLILPNFEWYIGSFPTRFNVDDHGSFNYYFYVAGKE